MIALVLPLVLLVGAATFGGAWYYASRFRDEALLPSRGPDPFDLRVTRADAAAVRITPGPRAGATGDWRSTGTFGLEWAAGYGQLGAIRESDDTSCVRDWLGQGAFPPGPFDARVDSFAFRGDPATALGLPLEDVVVQGPLGALPAWLVPAEGGTWAIFVHGKGAGRREALRMLPALNRARLPTLVVTYRNDPGAPPATDGFYRFGVCEWEDVEAAVRFAIAGGARGVILAGFSMGGGVVLSFLRRSPLRESVAAVILDSPLLHLAATVRAGSGTRVPSLLVTAGMALVRCRFGIDWRAVDYLRDASALNLPILLFHGEDDTRVPISTSDELARLRPDLVTYVRTPGAGHVRSWNRDPVAYEAAVEGFIARLGLTVSGNAPRP